MSKIVCEICGTTYDDTAGVCPVCGWKPGKALEEASGDVDDLLDFDIDDAAGAKSASAGAKAAGKVAFDYDAVNGRRQAPKPAKPAKPAPETDDEEEEEDEESGSNTFLVIILVLLILALLAVSAYIGWTKILKPRMGSDDNKPQETVNSQVVDPTVPEESVGAVLDTPAVPETIPQETEPLGVPCTNLSLLSSVDTLTYKGQYTRLLVKAEPENTTEKMSYASADTNVATIDETGRIIAMGEGETVIVVTCGAKRIETPVAVHFPAPETEPTQSTEAPSTAVATPNAGTVLKLKKTDVTIGKKGVYITLELENGISANDVKWSTSDSGVATVWGGNVTAIGRGTCVITAEYNGQKAQCVVRVSY